MGQNRRKNWTAPKPGIREREVAELACDGLDTKQIADALFISVSTVKNHLHSLYKKTGTAGRSDLVRILLHKKSEKIAP